MKPFIRSKSIKGNEYLYEITPYYDPEKGKWRQKSRYLGKNVDGEPVRKTNKTTGGQIYDLGEYIPAYWAIREYKVIEALLSCFSPEEAGLLVIVAINRLIHPCSPRHLDTWLSGTYLTRLIPGPTPDPGSLYQLLQNLSNRSVISLFSRMVSIINSFSERRILMSGRLTDFSQYEGGRGGGTQCKDLLEGDLGIRMMYDPDNEVLTGCEITDIRRDFIDNSLNIMCSGRISGSILCPNWDYFSPVLIQNLVTAGIPFIIRPDTSYKPLTDEILGWDETTQAGSSQQFLGSNCTVREFTTGIGYTPVKGFILHDYHKERKVRKVFDKNLQNIQDIILKGEDDPTSYSSLIDAVAGDQSLFFSWDEKNHVALRDQDAILQEVRRLSRTCVLYQGEFSWEECFILTDTRWKMERKLFTLYRSFKQDLTVFPTDQIKVGILFVCFISLFIRELVMNRLHAARFDDLSTFDGLMAELSPIHVVKARRPAINPEKLTRKQKTILSYFGGLPHI